MTKEEHIQYWIQTAEKDWKAVDSLFKSKNYVHCLFFAHLVMEKLCKAHWIKDNKNNIPPKIHNLIWLIQNTKLQLTEEQLAFMDRMNEFQIEGRYPDYLMNRFKICNYKFTTKVLKEVKKIRLCLIEKLQ